MCRKSEKSGANKDVGETSGNKVERIEDVMPCFFHLVCPKGVFVSNHSFKVEYQASIIYNINHITYKIYSQISTE